MTVFLEIATHKRAGKLVNVLLLHLFNSRNGIVRTNTVLFSNHIIKIKAS